jgi:hypothetical protein
MRRLLLPLLLIAATASAQTIPIPMDVEIGYRWLDLKGSEGMYRSQINERQGLLLRALTVSTPDFRIDASDLGVGPAGSLRVDVGKADLYRLRLAFRRADAFSAVPSFAQHTFDRKREMLDLDLEILPGRKITPFVGYSINRYSGPGTSTYHVGQDEFLLLSSLKDRDREMRVGASFNTGRVYGMVTQGWRHFSSDESLTLAPGAGAGNNPEPVLGRPITAGGITRDSHMDGDTPFTNLYVTGEVTKRLRVIGNYARLSAESEGDEAETATGSFASFEIGRFFNGLNESVASAAKNKTTRGGVRGEFAIADSVDLFAGYQSEHRDLSGTALINSLFLQSITFGGADPRDFAAVLAASSSLERDQDVANLGISLRDLGPFAVRGEVRISDLTANVRPDLAEIVVPGSQGGKFERQINTFDLNASYTKAKLTLGAAWRHDDSDTPIFRTDFLARDRYRIRAQWATQKDFVRAGLTAEQTDQSNDSKDTGFTAKLRQYTGDVEVAPIDKLHLRASYSQYRTTSDISFRRPENFVVGDSFHQERGKSIEGGFAVFVKQATLDASVTRFDNTGTLPFKIDRYRARATFDIKEHAGIAAEYSKDKYRETLFPVANYEANRYGIYLRWRP